MRVLAYKNLPMRLPTASTVAYVTALHYFGAPGWAWGAFGVLAAFVWSVAIYQMCVQEQQAL